jgi:MoxR-like ATPase
MTTRQKDKTEHLHFDPGDWMANLGIHGWEWGQQLAVLTSLVSCQPVLLVGHHGAAKTMTAQRIAQMMAMKFWCYPLDKASFEDIVGFVFPDLSAENGGEIRYFRTPGSIWHQEFVLLDELLRAAPGVQSKCMELLLSGTCLGEPTALKYCWAATNPVSQNYHVSAPDDALVSRFGFLIEPPNIDSMSDEVVARIIPSWCEEDGRDIAFFDRLQIPELHRIRAGIEDAKRRVPEVVRTEGATLRDYLRYLYRSMYSRHPEESERLDSRTFVSLHRSLTCYRALRIAAGNAPTLNEDDDSILAVAEQALPLMRLREGELVPFSFYELHQVAWTAALGAGKKQNLMQNTLHSTGSRLDLVVEKAIGGALPLGDAEGGAFLKRLEKALMDMQRDPARQAVELNALIQLVTHVDRLNWSTGAIVQLLEMEQAYLSVDYAGVLLLGRCLDIPSDSITTDPFLFTALIFRMNQMLLNCRNQEVSSRLSELKNTLSRMGGNLMKTKHELTRLVSELRRQTLSTPRRPS